MAQDPQQPTRPPALHLRDRTSRLHSRGRGDDPCRLAMLGLVRLLARQAAQETFDDG